MQNPLLPALHEAIRWCTFQRTSAGKPLRHGRLVQPTGESSLSEEAHAAFAGNMHTAYKHAILRKYLPVWMQILASNNRTIGYVDCYAGPGVYPDGSDGSPLIALDIAEKKSKTDGCGVWCVFNEHDQGLARRLQESVGLRSYRERTLIFSLDAKDLLDHLLMDSRFAEDGRLSVPMFFFIDPFGLNVPMQMLKRIMEQPKTEILLTFMIKDVVRWSRTSGYEHIMMDLFDHPDPLSLIEQAEGSDYEQRAVNAFVNRLKVHAGVKHVIKYRICSQRERRTLFYLVHGSNHFKGFKLMKGIMYNLGIPGAFAYLGPGHPLQGQTFLTDQLEQGEIESLANYLVGKYTGMTRSFGFILEANYAEVSGIEKHFRRAVLVLERRGKVEISGEKRRKGTLKEDHEVRFL